MAILFSTIGRNRLCNFRRGHYVKPVEGSMGNVYVIFFKKTGRVGMEEFSLDLFFLFRYTLCFSGGAGF